VICLSGAFRAIAADSPAIPPPTMRIRNGMTQKRQNNSCEGQDAIFQSADKEVFKQPNF